MFNHPRNNELCWQKRIRRHVRTGLAMGKEVPTDCSINMMIGEKMYCFSGAKPKQMFMDDQAKMLMKAEENFKQMSMKK